MVYEIRYTEEAEKDLDAIYNFLSTEYQSKETAIKIIREISATIERLDTFPAARAEFKMDRRYREQYAGSYRIVFEITGNTVMIVRILPSIFIH